MKNATTRISSLFSITFTFVGNQHRNARQRKQEGSVPCSVLQRETRETELPFQLNTKSRSVKELP